MALNLCAFLVFVVEQQV